jgi:Golgi phosphoprotein 3 GPP34
MTALTYVPSLRGDAMLLTHGRAGTERLIGAALLLDGMLGGQLDVAPLTAERRRDGYEAFGPRMDRRRDGYDAFGPRMDRRRVIAGPDRADDPVLAELRARVLAGPPDSPRGWIDRTAQFAPQRIAAELVAAGVASPHERRFQRGVSVDARAEAAARDRLDANPALAAALFACGHLTPALPPVTSWLPAAAVAVIAALR